jgi:hypothetical protein
VQTSKQFTVFLENKPGRLASILGELARQKVNLVAMSVMDRHEHGVLRFVADDHARTTLALQALNTSFTESDVLLVELRNQPGALANVCALLADEHIHIDYAYCSSGGRNGKVMGVFKVTNNDKAIRVLGSGNNIAKRRLERRPMVDRRTYHKG